MEQGTSKETFRKIMRAKKYPGAVPISESIRKRTASGVFLSTDLSYENKIYMNFSGMRQEFLLAGDIINKRCKITEAGGRRNG